MNDENLYWMNYSIEIANGMDDTAISVGTVLVSENNEKICSYSTNQNSFTSWADGLLSKLQKMNIQSAYSLYLTINTLASNDDFDINKLIKEVSIDNVYFGVSDPNLNSYLPKDPVITLKNIYRYPDDLQKEILKQNSKYFSNSRQNIKYSPYYSDIRISNLVMEKLQKIGINISKNELDLNKQIDKLVMLIANKYGLEIQNVNQLLNNIVSEAFNEKYSSYDYSDDARSINTNWMNDFMAVYNKIANFQINDIKVLNVGVGSGNEAIKLFSHCASITFADIANNGLAKIKAKIPHSNIVLSRAEDLSILQNDNYDLYVSLRTYNSSFFNIKQAISEAHRVLKHEAIIIVSIANGFLCPKDKHIIPGLLIPGTEFVDIYRGIYLMKNMLAEFDKEGFYNIRIFPTNTEIYLSAIAK